MSEHCFPEHRPSCSFGIITDIQYADCPNGSNYHKTKTRYFSNGIEAVRRAVRHWDAQSPMISFVLQLGDIIDGRNNKVQGASQKALDDTLDVFSPLAVPIYHLVGNHELYNFSRVDLKNGPLNSSHLPGTSAPQTDSDALYYHFSPVKGFRVIILDTFEVSILGCDKTSGQFQKAYSILRTYNKNEDLNDPIGLARETNMFTAYNGGISSEQLAWLDQVLTEAEARQERVIVAGHVSVHAGSTKDSTSICWNHSEIVATLSKHKSCVLAYLSGHDHDGGHCVVDGVHYITLSGVLETPPGHDCFATAQVYTDRVEIVGSGTVGSYTLAY